MDIEAYNRPLQEGDSHQMQNINDNGSTAQETEHKSHSNRRTPAIIGALFTVIAWVLLFYNGYFGFFTALSGLVISIFGIRGKLKNLSISSIIASAVLILVFVFFEILILYMLNIDTSAAAS